MKKKVLLACIAMTMAASFAAGVSSYLKTGAASLLYANVEALATPELSEHVWDRYDYVNDAGTPCANCLEGGSDDCVIR